MPLHRQWIFVFDRNIKATEVLTIFKTNIWKYPSFYFEEHVSSRKGSHSLCKQDASWASEFPAEPAGRDTHQSPPCTGGLCRAPLAQAVCAPTQCALFLWDFLQAEVQRGRGLDAAGSTRLWLCCWGTSHHWQCCFSRLYLFSYSSSPCKWSPSLRWRKVVTRWPRFQVHSTGIVPGVRAEALRTVDALRPPVWHQEQSSLQTCTRAAWHRTTEKQLLSILKLLMGTKRLFRATSPHKKILRN